MIEVFVYFVYNDKTVCSSFELCEQTKGSLEAAGWPDLGESRMFWNCNGKNILIAGIGKRDAKKYCEIEMLNEIFENFRVAAGVAVNALKGWLIV